MSSCNCKVCQDHSRWVGVLDLKTDEGKVVFDEIMSRLEAAETDAVYWKMKYEGIWPSPQQQGEK